MFTKSSVFTRKKALLIVAGAAFLLLALIFVKWRIDSRTNFTTLADREKFLKNLGWEIEIHLRMLLYLIVEIHNMKYVKKLSLILMKSLYLNIKN